MSLCDTCREPGHCCKGFYLTGTTTGEPPTFWDDSEAPPSVPDGPFVPLRREWQWTVEFGPDTGRTYSAWRWSCPKLGADGRCTDYENRPQLCRNYEPGSTTLCIEHAPEFKGIPIVEAACA